MHWRAQGPLARDPGGTEYKKSSVNALARAGSSGERPCGDRKHSTTIYFLSPCNVFRFPASSNKDNCIFTFGSIILTMLKNFIKIAWRNLLKNRVYSAINILGLAFGMAVAILIALWIQDELTYNHYHANHSSLAQVMLTQTFNGQTSTQQAISIPLGGYLQSKYTQDFKHVSLTSWNDSYILSIGEKKIMGGGMWVQSSFPGMLSLRMIEGDINGLKDPSSMLINQSTATALFGDADPMNKTIRINNRYDLKVAGVYEDMPKNSTLYDTHITDVVG